MKNLQSQTKLRKAEEVSNEPKEAEPCAEEMATGGTYWLFMFMVIALS